MTPTPSSTPSGSNIATISMDVPQQPLSLTPSVVTEVMSSASPVPSGVVGMENVDPGGGGGGESSGLSSGAMAAIIIAILLVAALALLIGCLLLVIILYRRKKQSLRKRGQDGSIFSIGKHLVTEQSHATVMGYCNSTRPLHNIAGPANQRFK